MANATSSQHHCDGQQQLQLHQHPDKSSSTTSGSLQFSLQLTQLNAAQPAHQTHCCFSNIGLTWTYSSRS